MPANYPAEPQYPACLQSAFQCYGVNWEQWIVIRARFILASARRSTPAGCDSHHVQPDAPIYDTDGSFFRVVQAGFAQKRKQLKMLCAPCHFPARERDQSTFTASVSMDRDALGRYLC